MFTKGRKKGTFRFSIRTDDDVKKAFLAGDFTNWRVVAMRRQKGNTFVKVVSLPAGTYEYKFIIDGCWSTDRDTDAYAMNPYGSVNSIAQVQ